MGSKSFTTVTCSILFLEALSIAVGQDIVYYKCKDSPVTDTSQFEFSCDAGKTIIVKSAVIGATDEFIPPQQCPITSNTCLKETTLVAELCTGRNSCVINQNFVFNESQILCVQSNNRIGNFININYTCIVPVHNNYGDICHFDEDVYSNNAVYLSSFPNFPEVMGPDASYQCSCLFTSKPTSSSSSSANVTIRTLLVKLTGALATCSERLSIIDSKDDNKLEFCSPCSSANNLTTISLASKASATVMSFRRDPNVSPFNGKFILEITVSSESSGVSSVGSMKCDFFGSTIYSSTSVSAMSSSTTTTTTTSALLNAPSSFSITNVQNTSSGATLGSSIMATNAEQSTLSSSKSAAETRSSSTEIPTGDATPTLASKTDSEKNAISTGAIVGIVLGVLGFLAVASLAAVCAIKNLRSKRNGDAQSKEMMPSALDHRLNAPSVDRHRDNEITTKINGLEVNERRISQYPNMQEHQDPSEHSYYNEGSLNIKSISDNQNQYEPLKINTKQQQTYINQPSGENSYQPLNFPLHVDSIPKA